jgi:hypothetical protein
VAPNPRPDYLVVEKVVITATGKLLLNNTVVDDPTKLEGGLTVSFSHPIVTKVRGYEPIFRIWVDMPYPMEPPGRGTWMDYLGLSPTVPIIGTVPLTLLGQIRIAGNTLTWEPFKTTKAFLKSVPAHQFGLKPPVGAPPVPPQYDDSFVKAYLTIRGDCIWSDGPPGKRRYLNGEVLAYEGSNLFQMEPPVALD